MRETFPEKKKGDRLHHRHVNNLSKSARRFEAMFPGPETSMLCTSAGYSQDGRKIPDKLYGVLQETLTQNSSVEVKIYHWDFDNDEWDLTDITKTVWANPFIKSGVTLTSGTAVEIQWFRRYNRWIVTNAEC